MAKALALKFEVFTKKTYASVCLATVVFFLAQHSISRLSQNLEFCYFLFVALKDALFVFGGVAFLGTIWLFALLSEYEGACGKFHKKATAIVVGSFSIVAIVLYGFYYFDYHREVRPVSGGYYTEYETQELVGGRMVSEMGVDFFTQVKITGFVNLVVVVLGLGKFHYFELEFKCLDNKPNSS